jgi:hypothetical protein
MPREIDQPSWESIRKSRRWSATDGRWVLAELERSGLSAKQFSELHRVPVARVYQWCSRLRGEGRSRAAGAGETPRLLQVELPALRSATVADRIDIELLSGRRLRVPAGLDLEQVSALVAILERQ